MKRRKTSEDAADVADPAAAANRAGRAILARRPPRFRRPRHRLRRGAGRAWAWPRYIAERLSATAESSAKDAMALKVAFQMDPIERIDIRGNSTFALLLEAQHRGHDVFYYTPDQSLAPRRQADRRGPQPHRRGQARRPLPAGASARASISPRLTWCISARTRHSTWPISPRRISWSGCSPKTLVVNDPASVRNSPEKVFVLDFSI